MTNPKIEKINTDIEKVKGRISDFQSKLRDLERKKTELENEDIIALVRREKISDAELNALLRAIRKAEPEIIETREESQDEM